MTMGTGDITVVGMVGEAHLIEDIGVRVPMGVAVTIPGPMTLISKDLHRGLSQRFLLRMNDPTSGVRATGGLAREERDRYESEIQRLTAQLSAFEGRGLILEAQIGSLQRELSELRSKDAKLDAILSAIQERPSSTINNYLSSAPGPQVASPEDTVDGSAPIFIPSTIKSDLVEEERIAVQEETSSTSSVTSAASKLKLLRKGKT